MKIDSSKLNKIGVDRIVLNNFEITNFDNLKKIETCTDNEVSELFELDNSLFDLKFSVHLNLKNEPYTIASLSFNPNVINFGHNVYNSNVSELQGAKDLIIRELKKMNIDINLSEAKIKSIEINNTFVQNFKEFEEFLLVIGRVNYKKAIGLYSFSKEDVPVRIKRDRTLYLNLIGRTIKLYDKTFEVFIKNKVSLDRNLTRVELLVERDFYREYTNSLGLNNSFETLIENEKILEDLFKREVEANIFFKSEKYLEVIKRNLKYSFLNFRRTEAEKRKRRKELKNKGSEIPTFLKEERGVFEYLDKKSWIFDYSFLVQIVMENMKSKYRKRMIEQIKKKYLLKNNLEIIEKLKKTLLG